MLDVHPPHHSPNTWRDFFLHIATIVVGLIIAVGLEQSVEFLHHRHEVKETREALRLERKENCRNFAVNTTDFRLQIAELQNNLRVLIFLQQHPSTPEENLPGVLTWGSAIEPPVESVWKNAQQSNVIALMPRDEAENIANLYRMIDDNAVAESIVFEAFTHAASYALIDPDPSHMSPVLLADEIDLTRHALEMEFRLGILMENLNNLFPDFAPAPTAAELHLISGRTRTPADQAKLATAKALTDAGLTPLRAARIAALKAAGDTHIN